MTAPPRLTVHALGPIQELFGSNPAPKWKYLQSPELLLYLMCETDALTARGRTRERIAAELPIPSSDGNDDNFFARLTDLRNHIGKEWIVLTEQSYKFNYTLPCEFDVREFERSVQDARRLASGASPEKAIPLFQQALALYRGDFMQGHTKRRSAQNAWADDEREWYLTKREELRGARSDCLQQLGELLFAARRYREAVEVNRQLVAELDDDDDAHERILYALAAQGLKSEALRHFKQLRARRGKDALDAKLATLIEKIKRNENLGDTRRDGEKERWSEGEMERTPPFQVPADLPRFVGRVEQFEILRNEILRAPASPSPATRHLSLVGMGGIGKTSLAIHGAYALREHFPDGVLWGNLRESESLAILASWERAYGCDFSGLPDLNARAASFRSLMHDKRVLVILDDVTDAADARPLLLNGAQTRTIFTTRSADIAAALDAFVIEMPVLHADESADLLTRILGTARVAGQEMFAREICNLLGNLPLALDITAHRLVSRPSWTLREMVERLRAQMRRLDELQLADRAVRATFALSWDALNDAQKNVLAHVGVFDARSFTADALAYVIGDVGTNARDILDALVALSLVSFESSTRYRQHPLLADFSREKLDDGQRTTDGKTPSAVGRLSSASTRLSEYYLGFATTNRKNYLALEDEWDNLNVGIEIAHTQEMWQSAIAYGDVLTDAWFARGRFTDARRNYPYVMRGARELEEQDPYINASLNWGKACIDQGDYAEAEEHLQHGLQTSREVNDEYNIASALFLLGRVSVERSEYDAAQKYLEESQAIRERIGDRAGVAETLYMRARVNYVFFNFEVADQIGSESIRLQEQLPSSHQFIVSLRWVGVNATYLNQFDKGENYILRALKLSEEMQDQGELAMCFYCLAILFWRKENYSEARAYAAKSLPILRKIGDRKSEGYATEQLGKIHLRLGEFEKALELARTSLAISRDLGDTLNVARQMALIGDIYKGQGRDDIACKWWLEGFDLATQLAYTPLARSLQKQLDASGCEV